MNILHASRALPKDGESCSGDAVFARVGDGVSLFVVIDVLGHGPNAHRVAQRALQLLEQLPIETGATAAIDALHQGLHGTRGAVATAFSLHHNDGELCGVGNIAFRLLGFRCSFVSNPGILGMQSPRRLGTRFRLGSGQGVILHSDGISQRFDLERIPAQRPAALCEYLLSHHRHSHDDASVLIVLAEDSMRGLS